MPASPFTVSTLGENAPLGPAVLCIGNFDGMHRGHQAVIEAARALGTAEGLPVRLLSFEPHPRTLFRPETPVFRLTPPEAKARIARALGLDGLVVAPFDRDFAAQSASEFAEAVLARGLGARRVVVGPDFRFGAGRGGDAALLAQEGARLGFAVTTVAPVAEGTEPVSSSRIRKALGRGDIATANALLGYRWFVEAEVIHGDKRGRLLGYPTANMRLAPETTLAHGIYAVWLDVDGTRHAGVASFGRRPTFDDGPPLLETFVFGFSGDLYGKAPRVTFAAYLRPEMKFDGVEPLIAQMDRDSAEAKAILAAARPLSTLDEALGEDARL